VSFSSPLAPQLTADLVSLRRFPGIYKLWKVFDNSSNVGGACGEIAAFKDKGWRKLLNPLGESSRFLPRSLKLLSSR